MYIRENMIKPDWNIFKTKFSENPQYNFEWFCYLLFCKEFNKEFGIFRYKNQASIETEPVEINSKVVGWQAKFYETALSEHKDEILSTIDKAKKYYPSITKLLFYTNEEWGQARGKKPKGLLEIEEKAQELNIELEWRVASFFESSFVCHTNEIVAKHFFVKDSFLPTVDDLLHKVELNIKGIGKRYAPNLNKYMELNQRNARLEEYFSAYDISYIITKLNGLFYTSDTYDGFSLNSLNGVISEIPTFESAYEGHYSYFGNDDEFNIKKEDLLDLNELFEKFQNDIIDKSESLFSNSLDYFISYIEKFKDYLETFLEQVNYGTELLYLKYPRERSDTFNAELHHIDLYRHSIENAIEIIQSDEFNIYIKKCMLMIGEALIGKTHTFCDIALHRLNNDKPTVLAFGNLFKNNKTILDNIMEQLGIINTPESEFLEGLSLLATRYSAKTLIMIDGINEKDSAEVFREGIIKLCEQINHYPNLALAMSIRDVEMNRIKTFDNEEYIDKEVVQIQHKGFEGIELEAVTTFCNALEVEVPKIPFHISRLFINPGILFLYIELIKNSENKLDTSIINPTIVFKRYLYDLERKFYHLYSDEIDKEDEVVIEAVREIISLGTNEDFVNFYLVYKDVKKRLKTLHNKVLEFLISEGVLNKLTENETVKVYFTYQKFENFFIADYLLENFEDNKENISELLKGHNGAITEALLMQTPEKLNKEVFELNRWLLRDEYICELYIKGLVWRSPSSIKYNTFKYINFILGYENLYEVFLDTFLQLSTIPNHPLNFNRMDDRLKKYTIAERDYYWSIYLHHSFQNGSIVKRLINWAWNKKKNLEIEDESLYLYGLTLGWFLTSSNRTLRDGTTKALVNIFTNKINVFLNVLKSFEAIDDLYVLERLYAIAYGVILRSENNICFKELGEYIYNTVFNVDFVTEHILLREYASSTVEFINNLYDLEIDKSKIYPPYNQNHNWELPSISKDEINLHRDDYSDIFYSTLDGDFKIYVVYGAINHFLNLKIYDRPHAKLPKERYEDFFKSLTPEQEIEYDKTRLSSNEILKIINEFSEDDFEKELELLDLEQDNIEQLREEKLNQSNFKNLLTAEQLREYNEFIVNYTIGDESKFAIDVKSIKRLIFLEAIRLGWKKELFDDFDGTVGNRRRMEHQTERVGKKYQWIAFHKVLAKLTDNYEYQDGRGENKISEYKGTYQLYLRDIDPTTILKEKNKKETKWWFNIDNDFENKSISDIEWMGSTDNLPSISSLVQLNNGNKDYLLHRMSFSIDGNKNTQKCRNLYYHINTFILEKSNLELFVEWLNKVNYFGQHKMPQSSNINETFLREYPDSDVYKYFDTYYYGQIDWDDDFVVEGEKFHVRYF